MIRKLKPILCPVRAAEICLDCATVALGDEIDEEVDHEPCALLPKFAGGYPLEWTSDGDLDASYDGHHETPCDGCGKPGPGLRYRFLAFTMDRAKR